MSGVNEFLVVLTVSVCMNCYVKGCRCTSNSHCYSDTSKTETVNTLRTHYSLFLYTFANIQQIMSKYLTGALAPERELEKRHYVFNSTIRQ